MSRPILAALAAAVIAAPALAAPPDDAVPLSEILRAFEGEADFAYFKEIEWDDDHWEVEYYRTDGSEVEVDVDPRTGQPR